MKHYFVLLMICLWAINGYCAAPLDGLKPPSRKYRVPRYSKKVVLQRLNEIEHAIDMRSNGTIRRLINSYLFGPGRQTTEQLVGYSSIYFPIFEHYLRKHRVPSEIKYLSVIESHLDPKAISPMGARGLWQFMPKTARLFDLQINNYVDERYDIHKASNAAARYLSELFDRYQDWTLAIAAYNCGPGNLNKAIRKGKSKNFWRIKKHLPRETQGYVQKFIAVKYVMTYYMFYDIRPIYPDYDHMLTQSIRVFKRKSFQQISEETGIAQNVIEHFNPKFKRKVIPPSAKGHSLVLPKIGPIEAVPIQILGYKPNDDPFQSANKL
ncbi:MAG: lytic transglycosylase domain-containing protein [Bacteroidota bacterium]